MKRLVVGVTTVVVMMGVTNRAQANIEDGLIAHCEFEGTSAAAVDSAGSNDGTNCGAV